MSKVHDYARTVFEGGGDIETVEVIEESARRAQKAVIDEAEAAADSRAKLCSRWRRRAAPQPAAPRV